MSCHDYLYDARKSSMIISSGIENEIRKTFDAEFGASLSENGVQRRPDMTTIPRICQNNQIIRIGQTLRRTEKVRPFFNRVSETLFKTHSFGA